MKRLLSLLGDALGAALLFGTAWALFVMLGVL